MDESQLSGLISTMLAVAWIEIEVWLWSPTLE